MADEEILEKDISDAAQHVENANSGIVFNNHVLVSQLLRDYIGMPVFEGIQPEDIEDVTEKYHAFLGVEFETDKVKKVRIHTKEKNQKTEEENIKEVYVIPLIEHKSRVDYDVSMQLLRYMVVIWYDYAKQFGEKHRNKHFRYPMIIPIVYHEGKEKWTADLNLFDRIDTISGMEKYIPTFEYKVVSCRAYTEEELWKKHDEMSLIMLLNRVQTPEDFHKFLTTPQEYIKEVFGDAPEDIRKIIKKIFWSLLMKMGVPVEEAQEAVENMEEGHMGYLFENIEKMDIQEERRKTEKAENHAKASEDMLTKIVSVVIQEKKEENYTKDEVIQILKEKYYLVERAEEMVQRFW